MITIIEATEFTQEATLVSLDFIPTTAEMDELFINDSVVLEF